MVPSMRQLRGMACQAQQGAEVWEALGQWVVAQTQLEFGPGTKERFQMASSLQPDEVVSQQLSLRSAF